MSPTVLLVHAFPCDHRLWEAQASALEAAGWRVVAPDLPGFGGTALPDGEPSLPAVADWLLDLLRDQGVDKAAVAGVSLGGYLAMELLRRDPERFAAVLLCDTKASADTEQAAANRRRLADAVEADPASTARVLRQAVLPGLLGASTFAERPEVAERVGSWLDEASAATVAWYQRAMAQRPDSHDLLAGLSIPALVLWGEEDALSPEAEQSSMLEVLARGAEVRIARAGHLAVVESPEQSSRAMVNFLAQVRAPFTDS